MVRAVGQGVPWRDRRILAGQLRAARRAAGMRQQDLAELLGVPQSFIARYEAGDRQLTLLEVRAVCNALGLPFLEFARIVDTLLSDRKEFASD
jgi:transcriptional regulator with XRE-family HTH domain